MRSVLVYNTASAYDETAETPYNHQSSSSVSGAWDARSGGASIIQHSGVHSGQWHGESVSKEEVNYGADFERQV